MHKTLPLLLLTACASPLADDFEDELHTTGGCGDVVFYAYDDDDTILLTVQGHDLLAAAQEAGEITETTFDLPDTALDVRVEVGGNISDAVCDDVIENGGPRVALTYVATAGEATITVRPGAELDDARADLHLRDVVLEPEGGGEAVTMESFEIEDVSVGWYAG